MEVFFFFVVNDLAMGGFGGVDRGGGREGKKSLRKVGICICMFGGVLLVASNSG
jgi:hypothetical protein